MTTHSLTASELSAGYGDSVVLDGLDLAVPPGRISVIVGANACGKSTLLRTMSRLISPQRGHVLLDGKSIHRIAPRELARTLGLLPQSPIAPEGITVADLVSRGRHPHQGLFSRWTKADDEAVAAALAATRTVDLAERPVDELSGGQRQRVWIAMALAQPAARRADDLPRHQPSDRGAGPAHGPQPSARHDDRHGAARSQPGGALRRPPRRDGERPPSHAGTVRAAYSTKAARFASVEASPSS